MTATLTSAAVREHTSPSLRCLDGEQYRLYRSIPPAMEYVYHRSFSLPNAEDRLFGPRRREIPVQRYALLPEIPDGQASARLQRGSLSAEDERTLFMRYNYAKYRLRKLQDQQHRRLSTRRALEMADWHRRVLRIRAEIARANLPLVPAMAKRVSIPKVEFGELISEGYMAVLRCIEKFDAARGFKFSTYACRSILKCFHRLTTKAGRYREYFGVEFDPRMQRSDYAQRRHEEQRADTIEAIRDILRRNHANLTDVERTVVLERFAIFSRERPRTLSEVGKTIRLTREAVRQIQKRALTKIRAAVKEQFAS